MKIRTVINFKYEISLIILNHDWSILESKQIGRYAKSTQAFLFVINAVRFIRNDYYFNGKLHPRDDLYIYFYFNI